MQYRNDSKRNLLSQVFAWDAGVCNSCALDAHAAWSALRVLPPDTPERAARAALLAARAPRLLARPALATRLCAADPLLEGFFWQAPGTGTWDAVALNLWGVVSGRAQHTRSS